MGKFSSKPLSILHFLPNYATQENGEIEAKTLWVTTKSPSFLTKQSHYSKFPIFSPPLLHPPLDRPNQMPLKNFSTVQRFFFFR